MFLLIAIILICLVISGVLSIMKFAFKLVGWLVVFGLLAHVFAHVG